MDPQRRQVLVTRIAVQEFVSTLLWHQFLTRRRINRVISSETKTLELSQKIDARQATAATSLATNQTISRHSESIRRRLRAENIHSRDFVDSILRLLQFLLDNRDAFLDLINLIRR